MLFALELSVCMRMLILRVVNASLRKLRMCSASVAAVPMA